MGRLRIKKKALIVNPTGKNGGNHQTRLLELISRGLIRPEGLMRATVEHDDWCGLLVGSDYCNCHPTINGIDYEQ